VKNYEAIFDDSYHRVLSPMKNSSDFFEDFYKHFITSSPIVAKKFRNTNIAEQQKMLKASFFHMFNFFLQKQESDYMERIASKHGKKELDIKPELYDLWLKCVIDTVKKHDREFNDDIELAWRMIMSTGITYMKFKYDH
jgi:hemoglobin-like flavoprotein